MRIRDTSPKAPRIEPEKVAEALGAEIVGQSTDKSRMRRPRSLHSYEHLDDAAIVHGSRALARALAKEVPEQFRAVLEEGWGQIDESFLGFVAEYEQLARVIPLDTTVIDFGCCYAPQAWYFRRHARYIGIDRSVKLCHRFSFENTEHHETSIQDWITKTGRRPERAFAICQYVPDMAAQSLVRETFNNVFCYYP